MGDGVQAPHRGWTEAPQGPICYLCGGSLFDIAAAGSDGSGVQGLRRFEQILAPERGDLVPVGVGSGENEGRSESDGDHYGGHGGFLPHRRVLQGNLEGPGRPRRRQRPAHLLWQEHQTLFRKLLCTAWFSKPRNRFWTSLSRKWRART